jgi:small neutral amino acid transporter SnatA (MarC family)
MIHGTAATTSSQCIFNTATVLIFITKSIGTILVGIIFQRLIEHSTLRPITRLSALLWRSIAESFPAGGAQSYIPTPNESYFADPLDMKIVG